MQLSVFISLLVQAMNTVLVVNRLISNLKMSIKSVPILFSWQTDRNKYYLFLADEFNFWSYCLHV